MKFKAVVLFSLKEFNDNQEKKGYRPQDGDVINVFFHNHFLLEMVAVGFSQTPNL